MTDNAPENPVPDDLYVEMRKGDKFVRVMITDEKNLADPSFQSFVMKSLTTGMINHKAIKVPLPEAELRRLAARKASELVKTAELLAHGFLADELGISVEDAAKVAELAAAATVSVQ